MCAQLPVPSTYPLRLVNIELPGGLIDDGRDAHPDPHRPPPRGQKPPRPGAQEPRAAPSADRPPTHRAAPHLRRSDRLFWVLLSRLWHDWAEAVAIVQPETVIRWHRTGFKLLWTWKSRQRGPGRPAVAPELRALIRRMAEANPLWGAPRIHGELRKLGLEIAQATVSKYLVHRRTPPSQTWRTFLANHIGTLVSVDFFVVPMVFFKVLFVFVVLAHDRRRVVHVNVTDTPTAQWTAEQLVEAFPWDTEPRYLLRGVLEPGSIPGDPRGQDRPAVPVAESLCRTSHRDPAPRVPRPHGGVERRPPASPAP